MTVLPEEDKKKLLLIVSGIEKFKGEEITIIDLRGIYPLTDYFLISTCESPRQMEAVADGVVFGLKDKGYKLHHREGSGDDKWFLLDYNDIVVSLFYPESRSFYNLERLYKNAPKISVSTLRGE